jgi:hypothetical protein
MTAEYTASNEPDTASTHFYSSASQQHINAQMWQQFFMNTTATAMQQNQWPINPYRQNQPMNPYNQNPRQNPGNPYKK